MSTSQSNLRHRDHTGDHRETPLPDTRAFTHPASTPTQIMALEPEYHTDKSHSDASDITVDPVIKSNWKTKGARNYWSEHMSTFISLVPEFMNRVVTDGQHPRDAFIFDSNSAAEETIRTYMDDDISILVSKQPRENRAYKMFTSYENAVSMTDKKLTENYFIIGKNKSITSEISQLLSTQRRRTTEEYNTLSEHFGYPSCCADFHQQTATQDQHDPLYKIACHTESTELVDDDPQHIATRHPDPFLNQFWRYHGFRFSYHLPCSYECGPSGQRARTNYELYKTIADDTYAELDSATATSAVTSLLSWLCLPTYLSTYHGLTHLKNAYSIGSYHTDTHWDEKQLHWIRDHEDKPELEVNHPTTQLEDVDPEAGAL